MTPQQARAYIEQAFKSEWGATPPVDYNNDMANVPAPPFVRLAVRNAGVSEASSMTGDLIRYERAGVIFVQVFTALGVGPAQADTLARRASEILEGRQWTQASTGDTLRLGAASQTDVGNNGDGHWQVNVSVPFTFCDYRALRYA